jgi:hypothetical protein
MFCPTPLLHHHHHPMPAKDKLSHKPSTLHLLTTHSSARTQCHITSPPHSSSKVFSLTPSPLTPPLPASRYSNNYMSVTESSHSDIKLQPHTTMTSMTSEIPYAPATIIQQSSSHILILSAGCIMIGMICVFKNACHHFFQHKSIAEANHVEAIIYNFEGSKIQSWVNTNLACLTALTFSQFILEFKKKFLPCNWQDDLVAIQISMQGTKGFLAWTKAICEANGELGITKSTYHIEEDKLQAHFIPRLSPGLKLSYDTHNTHDDLDKISDLDAWLKRVDLLDQELDNKRVEWVKIAIEAGQAPNRCHGVLHNLMSANVPPPYNGSSVPPSTGNKTGTPKLTQTEYDLLKAHCGCFCCCLFYVGHISPNCTLRPDECPSAKAVKNCMLVYALKAKAAFDKKQSHTVVAAVFKADNNDSDISLCDDKAEEYVNPTLSFPEHLWWTCCINAPVTCAPTPVRALIDHGSPPVLISSEFVDIMCLPCRKLFKSFSISCAIVEKGKKSDTTSVLDEYCKLHLQSQDASWKSHVVNAIICLSLHTDLILGLDFLARNKIVVDAKLQMAVAKDSDYDLLNPSIAVPHVPIISPHLQ